ncbi:hypothetical protein PROFUN_12042 [Planoprotostelium fungivorum]|uniref:Uncharacterized protein n=1 Tax=Planoprotostelium fungivorum TaxID=1890364 RepID=A0A2P6MXI5_9EUKA|nr:hypothetical protein PROFUN_12042 [Planoprotostelium fungivorum]
MNVLLNSVVWSEFFGLKAGNISTARNGMMVCIPIEREFDTKQIFNGEALTFGHLHDKPLYTPGPKPFKRILSTHAQVSIKDAVALNWMSAVDAQRYDVYHNLSHGSSNSIREYVNRNPADFKDYLDEISAETKYLSTISRLDYIFQVLDPSLKNEKIFKGEALTFGDLHDKPLYTPVIPQGPKPFKRILSTHAQVSIKDAVALNWMSAVDAQRYDLFVLIIFLFICFSRLYQSINCNKMDYDLVKTFPVKTLSLSAFLVQGLSILKILPVSCFFFSSANRDTETHPHSPSQEYAQSDEMEDYPNLDDVAEWNQHNAKKFCENK